MSDTTGPIGDITMMGYGTLDQNANGIHLRLKARAFIFLNPSFPSERLVFVCLDAGNENMRLSRDGDTFLTLSPPFL